MAKKTPWLSHIIVIFFCILCIAPFWIVIAISLTSDTVIRTEGYSFFVKQFDFSAYKYVLNNSSEILRAYGVTLFVTFFGTFLSVMIMALLAYPLSRKNYSRRGLLSFMLFFTMLFSGGMVPSYILISQYLHLRDNMFVYILPTLVSAFHVILLRTFFQQLPEELRESAKLDGCGEARIFFQIILPLSKPSLATVALLTALGKWNDWMTSLLYIDNPDLISLQYLLQRIIMDVELIKENMVNLPMDMSLRDLPTESMRMVMVIVSAGPMMCVFPFFQKYFARGLTVGAVKG